jgi:hypothetical protein
MPPMLRIIPRILPLYRKLLGGMAEEEELTLVCHTLSEIDRWGTLPHSTRCPNTRARLPYTSVV